MAREKTRGGPRPVRQDRARATRDALVTAGEQLLDGRDPEAISLEELLARAGASASSFYQRFASKERFVDHLHARFCEKISAASAEWTSIERWAGHPLEEVATSGISGYLAFRRAHAGALRSLEIVEARHPDLMARRREVDLALARRVRACVLSLRSRDGRAPSMVRVDLALDLAVSTVRAAVDDGKRVRAIVHHDDERLVADLVPLIVHYLLGAP